MVNKLMDNVLYLMTLSEVELTETLIDEKYNKALLREMVRRCLKVAADYKQNLEHEKTKVERIKEVEVYDNGVARIVFQDGETMLVNQVWYTDAILTGWDESEVGIKR